MPYTLQPIFNHSNNSFQNSDAPWRTVVGRLKKGYSRADATAELKTILHQQDRLYLDQNTSTLDRKTSEVLTNGSFIHSPSIQSLVMTLMGLILDRFLPCCFSPAPMSPCVFFRAVVRRGEIAIQLALGVGGDTDISEYSKQSCELPTRRIRFPSILGEMFSAPFNASSEAGVPICGGHPPHLSPRPAAFQ